MKGLLIKDFKLLKNTKNSMLLILLIAVVMAANLKDASFIIIYLGLIGATLGNGTISYDEFDKGYAFLLSLPVARKGYVLEKYAFGLLLSGGGWLLGTIVATIAGVVKGNAVPVDTIMMGLALLPMVLILLSVLLPIHIKYGSEKSRIVMVLSVGGLFAVFVMVIKLIEKLEIDLNRIGENLPAMGAGMVALCGIAAGTLILLASCRISISIMEKKEF